MAEPDEAPAPGRVTVRDPLPSHDQLPFTVDLAHSVSYQAVWPYGQWEQWARTHLQSGVSEVDWLSAVLATRIARAMRTDVLVTNRPTLIASEDRYITEANPMSPADAVAVIGLYLRLRNEFVLVGPNQLTLGEHLMLWSAVRAQLPSGWRWSSALVTHGAHVGRRAPTLLHGSLYERLVRALRHRDRIHAASMARQNNRAADAMTEAFDDLLVNTVGAFDAAARAMHVCAGLPASQRHNAGWQKRQWRSAISSAAPDLIEMFAEGTTSSTLFRILRVLRNTVHGEALHPTIVRHTGAQPDRALVALPEDDSAELEQLFDLLGGADAWGLVALPGRGLHIDATVFVEHVLPEIFVTLDRVLALTPVEGLPGVSDAELTREPPDDLSFGLGTRVRVSLLLGLPVPTA